MPTTMSMTTTPTMLMLMSLALNEGTSVLLLCLLRWSAQQQQPLLHVEHALLPPHRFLHHRSTTRRHHPLPLPLPLPQHTPCSCHPRKCPAAMSRRSLRCCSSVSHIRRCCSSVSHIRFAVLSTRARPRAKHEVSSISEGHAPHSHLRLAAHEDGGGGEASLATGLSSLGSVLGVAARAEE